MDSSRVLLGDQEKASGPPTRRSISQEPAAGRRTSPQGKEKQHPPPTRANRVLDRSYGLSGALDPALEAELGAPEAQHRLRALRVEQKAAAAIEIERRVVKQARKSAKEANAAQKIDLARVSENTLTKPLGVP